MIKFERPTTTYQPQLTTNNSNKYQNDRDSVPTVPISAAKIDSDFNRIYDAAMEIWNIKASGKDNLKESIDFLSAEVSNLNNNIDSIQSKGIIAPSDKNTIYGSTDGKTIESLKITSDFIIKESITDNLLAKSLPGSIKISDSNGQATNLAPAGTKNIPLLSNENNTPPSYRKLETDSLNDNIVTKEKLHKELINNLPQKSYLSDSDKFALSDSSNSYNATVSFASIKEALPKPPPLQFAEVADLFNSNPINKIIGSSVLLSLEKSLGQNGHYTLPGGLIIQWGLAPSGNVTVTLPRPFPNNLFHISATSKDVQNSLTTVSKIDNKSFKKTNYYASSEAYFFAIGN